MLKIKKAQLILFYCSVALFWMTLHAYTPILVTYGQYKLGASASMMGTVIGSYGLSQMLLRIPLGILSDRWGKRKPFVIFGALVGTLSAFGMAMAKTPQALLFFRALAGCSASAWVNITVLFSSYWVNRTPGGMAKVMVFNNIGMIAATFLGGQLAQHWGEHKAIVLACIFGLCSFTLSWFIVEPVDTTVRKPLNLSDYLSCIRERQLASVCIVAILLHLVTNAFSGFVPAYIRALGGSSAQQGYYTSLGTIGAFATTLLTSRGIFDRLGSRKTVLMGSALTYLAMLAIPTLGQTPVLVLVFQVISGFGLGMMNPVLLGMAVSNIEPQRHGAAMGFYQSLYALGMFIGPVLAGFISQQLDLRISLLVIALIGGVNYIVSYYVLLLKRLRKNTD